MTERPSCGKCDQPHVTPQGYPSCKAHRSKTGTACRANPVRGAAVCTKHGGSSRAVKKNAAARVAEAKVEERMGELRAEHDRPDEHPFAALLDMSRRVAATTRALEAMVDDYRADGDDERLQAALAVYERFGRLSMQVSKTVLDANLDERLVRVNEAQAAALCEAVGVALAAVDLTDAQRQAFVRALTDELTAYRSGARPLPLPVAQAEPTYRPARLR